MNRCCACDKILPDDEELILVAVNRVAQWDRPTIGNILAAPAGQACAQVCSSCKKEKRTIQYAIEYQPDCPGLPGRNIIYHKIAKLQTF